MAAKLLKLTKLNLIERGKTVSQTRVAPKEEPLPFKTVTKTQVETDASTTLLLIEGNLENSNAMISKIWWPAER